MTRHRPGIARISGDKIILDGTIIGEVERYHAKTLKIAIEKTNEEVAIHEESERVREERMRRARR